MQLQLLCTQNMAAITFMSVCQPYAHQMLAIWTAIDFPAAVHGRPQAVHRPGVHVPYIFCYPPAARNERLQQFSDNMTMSRHVTMTCPVMNLVIEFKSQYLVMMTAIAGSLWIAKQVSSHQVHHGQQLGRQWLFDCELISGTLAI